MASALTSPPVAVMLSSRTSDVMVIQQWTDPFGRPMLRFADPADEFLAEATPVPCRGRRGVGGAAVDGNHGPHRR